mgnify:CR=1 FL=1
MACPISTSANANCGREQQQSGRFEIGCVRHALAIVGEVKHRHTIGRLCLPSGSRNTRTAR